MHISDLNEKTLTDPAWVAFDDGTDTYKAEFNEVVSDAAADAVADADLTDNEVAFTSGDALSPTAWTDVALIETGSTLATLFNQLSMMVKNVRFLNRRVVKRASFSGTTDANGNIQVYNGTDRVIISVYSNATGYIYVPFVYRSAWYARVMHTNAAGEVYTNTDVSGYYAYLENIV